MGGSDARRGLATVSLVVMRSIAGFRRMSGNLTANMSEFSTVTDIVSARMDPRLPEVCRNVFSSRKEDRDLCEA
jgi:hypothetical protein